MNKKLFLLPFLAISLLVGCGPTGDPSSSTGPEPESSEGPGSSETPGSSESEGGEKEIWEEDLVEGESTIAQVKAGTVGDYYKVRGTVIANSGSTFGLARGGDFIYCYNFKEGGNDNLAAHPLGSYVEVYAQTSVYSESIQLTAYVNKAYDENAKLTVLANDGEPVQPVECTTADSLSNAEAAGKLVKVSFVPEEDFEFTEDASDDQDLDGTVNGTKVTLRMEKYCPADVRAALIQENGATFEMGATYEVVGLGAARSDGTVRVFLCEGSTWTKTAEASFADPTEVIVDTEDGSAATVEAGKKLALVFMVEPATAKQVVVWSSADEKIATVDADGIVTGVKEGTVAIKAAAADDETVFAEIEVTVTKGSDLVYAPVAAPEAGVEYLLGIDQQNLGETLYITGQMEGFYGATTTDTDAAATVVLEEVTGGYSIKVNDTYLNVVLSGTYRNVKFENTATTVWVWNADYYTFTTTLGEDTVYVGTYGKYNTLSCSTFDKIATSYPARLYAETQKVPVVVETPAVETEYLLGIDQQNLGETLFVTGQMEGFYGATTTDTDAAATVVLEEVTGGYSIKVNDTYLNVVLSGTYRNVKFENTATTVWVWNADYYTFTTTLGEDTVYVGTYGKYNTLSCSTFDKIATSYPAHLYEFGIPSLDIGGEDTDGGETGGETIENALLDVTFAGAFPEGFTNISSNAPGWYSNGGLKCNKEGTTGFYTSKIEEQTSVKVALRIFALNANEKTASAGEHVFVIDALNAAGEIVATQYIDKLAVGTTDYVTLSGAGIVQFAVTYASYYHNGTAYCNVSLGGIIVTK